MKFTKRAMVHSKETRESQKEFWDEHAGSNPGRTLLHFDYLIKICLFFTKRSTCTSRGFELGSLGLEGSCSTTELSGTSQSFMSKELLPVLFQIPQFRSC